MTQELPSEDQKDVDVEAQPKAEKDNEKEPIKQAILMENAKLNASSIGNGPHRESQVTNIIETLVTPMDAAADGVPPRTELRRSNRRQPHVAQPGAFAAGGSSNTMEQPDAFNDSEDNVVVSSADPPTTGLVEARQVEEANLQEAQHMGTGQLQRQGQKQQPWNKLFCFLFFALCVVVVAILLGVGFAGTEKDKQPKATTTTTPSPTVHQSVATEVPTSSPTGVLDGLHKLLPNHTLQNLDIFGTPQNKAWRWLQDHPNSTDYADWKLMQRFVMATFFYAFEGEQWFPPIRERWLDYEKDECFWFSSGFGSFTEVNGTYKYTEWGIPWEPCNNETGEFEILFLQDLRLAELSPFIPPEVNLLTSLTHFDFTYCDIQVPLQEFLPAESLPLPHMRNLVMYVNDLTGTIPTQFFTMTDLVVLSLSDSELTGTLPTELGLLTSLTNLGIGNNEFIGTIPSEIGLMSSLRILTFGNMEGLSGTVPSELGGIETLVHLDMVNLKGLAGALPSEVSLLENLGKVRLTGAALSGTLPSNVCHLLNSSCSYEISWVRDCSLEFDCSKDLCGCDCPCSNTSRF